MANAIPSQTGTFNEHVRSELVGKLGGEQPSDALVDEAVKQLQKLNPTLTDERIAAIDAGQATIQPLEFPEISALCEQVVNNGRRAIVAQGGQGDQTLTSGQKRHEAGGLGTGASNFGSGALRTNLKGWTPTTEVDPHELPPFNVDALLGFLEHKRWEDVQLGSAPFSAVRPSVTAQGDLNWVDIQWESRDELMAWADKNVSNGPVPPELKALDDYLEDKGVWGFYTPHRDAFRVDRFEGSREHAETNGPAETLYFSSLEQAVKHYNTK